MGDADHSSRPDIAVGLERLPEVIEAGTSEALSLDLLFTLHQVGFASTGDVTAAPVSSYLTFSPLPGTPFGVPGGLFLWHCP